MKLGDPVGRGDFVRCGYAHFADTLDGVVLVVPCRHWDQFSGDGCYPYEDTIFVVHESGKFLRPSDITTLQPIEDDDEQS